MACKSTWTFSKGQEYMWWNNVETKPYGGYPQYWDVKPLGLLEEAHPGGRNQWDTPSAESEGALWRLRGIDDLRGGAKRTPASRAIGYIPTDEEWRAPNIYEDTSTGAPERRR